MRERLTALLPDGLDSVYFVNSGTEAIEGALKLAKRITGRTERIRVPQELPRKYAWLLEHYRE